MTHDTIEIPLTRGYRTLIDIEDLPLVAPHNWRAQVTGAHVYATAYIDQTITYLHRFLLQPPKGMVVDHASGDGLDNRRANIRVCSQADNLKNKRKYKSNTSGYRGVSPNSDGTYRAQIQCDEVRHYLGRFDCPIEAAHAYDEAAVMYFGEFARLNFGRIV